MTGIPATCEVWVDGVRYADGLTVEAPGDPVALSGLTVTWGRSSTVDQPEPASLTFTIEDPAGGRHFDETIGLGSKIIVWSVIGGRRVVVFAGRVTDLESTYDDDTGSRCTIAAVDLLGDLANRFVGDEPWPAETLAARAARIIGQVGIPAGNLTVDSRPAALLVSRVDVDRQPAATLLTDLATTGTAALWVVAGTDGVARLHIEDPTARPGLWVLGLGADGYWRPMMGAAGGATLDSCVIDRQPVRWTRALADLITRVTVRWLDQSTTPDTTERTLSIVDADVEALYGARGISVGTILASEAAATAAANLLLATHQDTAAWRASGLRWDLADTDPTTAVTALAAELLDNTTRYGAAVTISPMPEWVPAGAEAGLYVDGGTYEFADGRWLLSLSTTSAVAGGESITYQDTPAAVTYDTMAADVSFLDLIGVGAPPAADPADAGTRAGFPVPAPTDPYRTVPAALAVIADAVKSRLANRPMQFANTQQVSVNASGGATLDMRDTMAVIDGALFAAEATAPYAGNIMGTVSTVQTLAGTQPFRVFNAAGTANSPAANANPLITAIVWGTPR